MKIDVLTLFPDMIEQALSFSIPGRAQKSAKVEINAHQLRDWAIDKHGTVDDTPYGGGPGMVMRVDAAHPALEAIDPGHDAYRVMLSPDGEPLTQELVKQLAEKNHLVFLCGRYEGFDARITKYVDQKISIGPYVLSGGELPALVIIDSLVRLIPGVLGNEESIKQETFEGGKAEYPQFTRPEVYQGNKVPEVLLTGHHANIQAWRNSKQKNLESRI